MYIRRRDIVFPLIENEEIDLHNEFFMRFMKKIYVTEICSFPSDIQKAINDNIYDLLIQFKKRFRYERRGSSSTSIRKLQSKWLSLSNWLDPSVYAYLRKYKVQNVKNEFQINDIGDEKQKEIKKALLDCEDPLKIKVSSILGKRSLKFNENETEDMVEVLEGEPPKSKKGKNVPQTKEIKKVSQTIKTKINSQTFVRGLRNWGQIKNTQKIKRYKQGPLKSFSSDDLLIAAARIASKNGNEYLAKALNDALEKEKIKRKAKSIIPFTAEEAVLLVTESNVPKRTYTELHFSAKSRPRRADIYPTYEKMNEARIACYPPGIQVNQSVSEVPLQSLLNHTAERILQTKKNSLPKDNLDTILKLILNVKWGYDGSSGFSEWRQRFLTHSIKDSSEADLFCTSLVPLYLKSNDRKIWENPIPSSVRYCRPLTLQLGNESPELTIRAQAKIEHQIQHLKPYSTTLYVDEVEKRQNTAFVEDVKSRQTTDRKTTKLYRVEVYFHVQQTIVDPGTEADNLLTPTKIDCNICALQPDTFDQEKLNAVANIPPVGLDLQRNILSPLHASVCCFEFLINLACFNHKSKVISNPSERKAVLLKCFRVEMNVIMGKPRNGCNVSTAEANNAFKAFQSEKVFSRITGLDINIIHRFNVILKTISIEYEINVKEFSKYCLETGELLKKLYSWCTIPSVIHKLLWHGKMMATEVILPIGMMSNEAQKARNKGYKPFFLRHSKEDSKEHAMTEVIKHLMILGDPIITKHSLLTRKKLQEWGRLERDVIELLEIRKYIELKPKKDCSKEQYLDVEDQYEEHDSSDLDGDDKTEDQNSSTNVLTAMNSHYEKEATEYHQYMNDKGCESNISISTNTNVYQNPYLLDPNFHSHTPTNYSLNQTIPGLHYVHGSNISNQ